MPKRSREDSASSSPSTSLSSPVPSSPGSADLQIHHTKYIHITPELPTRKMAKCSLPPHKEVLAFSSIEDFETHYTKTHTHRCSECNRNFPTEHLLGLHINENHDPLSEVRRAKGEKTVGRFPHYERNVKPGI